MTQKGAVCSHGQISFMALYSADGTLSHTGRFEQEKSSYGTFPPWVEAYGAGCQSLAIASSPPLPHSCLAPSSSPGCCRRFQGRGRRGKALLSFHFLSLLRRGFAGSRDEEALTNAQQPVQALPGAVDEDSQRVPALLCPLHQAQ